MAAPSAVPADLAALLDRASARLYPLASRVVYFVETGSTNDVAADLAVAGAVEGTVVLAERQTRGRGRSGHTWFSPPGAGLYVSVVLRPADVVYGGPPAPPRWAGLLTLAAGVALAEGLRAATGLALDIKWPNDIVAADRGAARAADRRWRKIAGILAEGHTVSGQLRHVVLGYGVNVRSSAYPPEIADRASSLEAEAGRPVDLALVLLETLAALKREYVALRSGEIAALLSRWTRLSPSARGAQVSWDAQGTARHGVTAGIDDAGALLVGAAGGLVALNAGEVTWS